MELKFEKKELPVLSTAVREVRRTELTQEVKLSDGMPDIGRILTSWGQVLLRSKEWNRGELGLSGVVVVWTLYLPEDGTEPRSVESWLPFSMKWEIPAELREGPIHGDIRLHFSDARGISARKMMLRCGVSALCHGYTPDSADVFLPGELPEDVQLLKQTYPVRIPREAGEKTFLLDEEVILREIIPDAEKLLSAVMMPEINDVKVMGSRLAFKGNANLHMVFRCSEGKIKAADFELPFSQFTELDREYGENGIPEVQAVLTSLEPDLDTSGIIRLKAGMVGQYRIDEKLLIEVIADAYSPKRDVGICTESLKLPSILDERRELITARQQIPGKTNQCLDAACFCDFPSVRFHEDNVRLEMQGMVQILNTDEDETYGTTSVRWEVNSSFVAGENTRIEINAVPSGRQRTAVGPDGMSVEIPINLLIRTVSQTGIPAISGLELGEIKETEKPGPSLILARAEGSGLWNLAKHCRSTVAAIREANGLNEEPEQGRMLLIPVC